MPRFVTLTINSTHSNVEGIVITFKLHKNEICDLKRP